MVNNSSAVIKLEMTAQQVNAWCIGRQLIRKAVFPKEEKGIALLHPMLKTFYVIEHNHKTNEFFTLYKGKDIHKAIDTYLFYLCAYA